MQQISNIFDNYKGCSLWLMYSKSDIINNFVKVILHVLQIYNLPPQEFLKKIMKFVVCSIHLWILATNRVSKKVMKLVSNPEIAGMSSNLGFYIIWRGKVSELQFVSWTTMQLPRSVVVKCQSVDNAWGLHHITWNWK